MGKNNPSFIAKFGIGQIGKSTGPYLRSDFRKIISPWLGLEPTKMRHGLKKFVIMEGCAYWTE